MAKYLKDHPYMEPHGLQEQQDEDDDDFWEIDPYKESGYPSPVISSEKRFR